MTEVKKGWHSAYDIHYHLVLPVKYRKALLSEAITKSIKEVVLQIQERYQISYTFIHQMKSEPHPITQT